MPSRVDNHISQCWASSHDDISPIQFKWTFLWMPFSFIIIVNGTSAFYRNRFPWFWTLSKASDQDDMLGIHFSLGWHVASFVLQNTISSSRTRPSPRRFLLLLLMSVVANFADPPKALPGRAYFSRKILTDPKFWCHACMRLHLGGGTTVRRPVEDVPNRW